jgi:glycosyltransferase involved in cell wall biosynthesis
MRSSLALVSSSIWPETLNMTLIEAMGNGTPVISSNCGAPTEYIDHGINGFLFEAGNYRQLAEYMRFFLKNKKEATEMGLKGYQMVIEKFNPELVIQKHLYLYEQTLNRNHGNNAS